MPVGAQLMLSQIAAKFGGHKMAAGAHLPDPIDKAKQIILKQVETHLPKVQD
jgi:nanoRNase/pAp phosphatase (c-di-AMP/oligoRNAs hydrolase)